MEISLLFNRINYLYPGFIYLDTVLLPHKTIQCNAMATVKNSKKLATVGFTCTQLESEIPLKVNYRD